MKNKRAAEQSPDEGPSDSDVLAGELLDDGFGPSRNVTIHGDRGPGNHMQGWVQTDKQAHNAMWKIGLKNATALPLLHYMVAHIKRGSGGMVVSAHTLSTELGVSPRTVQGAIAVLKQWKFLQVLKSGNTNVYIINSQVAWQGKRGQRFATFNTSIKVHECEQDEEVDKLIEEAKELQPVPDMSFLGHIDDDIVGEATDADPPGVGYRQKK